MALGPLVNYYIISADLIRYAVCQSDLPPAYSTKDLYSPPYRDLSGQTGRESSAANEPGQQDGFLDLPATDILVSIPLAGTPVVKTTGSAFLSLADDAMHVPWRQDAPHKADYLVFTDGLGVKRGEFDVELYPSWSNLPPNRVASPPA